MKKSRKNKLEIGQSINLITVKHEKTGETMFVLEQICKFLEESTESVKDVELTGEEVLVISKAEHPEIFEQLVSLKFIDVNAQISHLLSNSGYHRLIKAINCLRRNEPFPETVPDHRDDNWDDNWDVDDIPMHFREIHARLLDESEPATKSLIAFIGHELNDQMRVNKVCSKLGYKHIECPRDEHVLMRIRPEFVYALNWLDDQEKEGQNYNLMVPAAQGLIIPHYRLAFEFNELFHRRVETWDWSARAGCI